MQFIRKHTRKNVAVFSGDIVITEDALFSCCIASQECLHMTRSQERTGLARIAWTMTLNLI